MLRPKQSSPAYDGAVKKTIEHATIIPRIVFFILLSTEAKHFATRPVGRARKARQSLLNACVASKFHDRSMTSARALPPLRTPTSWWLAPSRAPRLAPLAVILNTFYRAP